MINSNRTINDLHNNLVFIVEDNELYSLMLDYTLSNDSTAQCICFKTGEECIEQLKLDPILIILDYWLPGMNGRETFEEIKKIKPQVPVVLLTRNQDKKLKKDLLKNGLYDYLYKEEDSSKQIRNIISSVTDKILTRERRQTNSMRIIISVIFLISLLIVFMYLYR